MEINSYSPIKGVENKALEELQETTNVTNEASIFDTQGANADYSYESANISDYLNEEAKTAIIAELENQCSELEANFTTAKNSNGWLSKCWDKFKNFTGIGASSNKTQAQIDDLKGQLAELKDHPDKLGEVYASITGEDLTFDSLNAFCNGEISIANNSSAGQSLTKYSNGQNMFVDISADIASGLVAIAGAAAAPFTGGASLAVAAVIGGTVKTAIKASDCIGNEKKYKPTDALYDVATGAVNGLMGPLTNGLGGAAGTGVAKAFGLEALENTAKSALSAAGKEAVEEVAEQVGKKTLGTVINSGITKILAKQGTEYVLKEGAEQTLKTTIGKVAAYGVDMMVDGAISGAADGAVRAAAQGRFEDIGKDAFQGLVGGAIAAPIIGGGMRVATKAGSSVINKVNNKITLSKVLPDGSSTKFAQGEAGDCALLSMFDGMLGNSKTSSALQKSIATNADGSYSVKIGKQIVNITKDSLSDEILSDTTGVRLFEQAYKQLNGANSLDGGFADVVAEQFGLKPVHIDSSSITDETLKTIQKELDNNNAVLSLGLKVDASGVVDENGAMQHYFSIKNVDIENNKIIVADTYDTSKTLSLSFDDVKSSGVSIDGGTIKSTSLPNVTRHADDALFYGKGSSEVIEQVKLNEWAEPTVLKEFDDSTIITVNDVEIDLAKYKKAIKQLNGDPSQAIVFGATKDAANGYYKVDGITVRQEILLYGDGKIVAVCDDDVAVNICKKAQELPSINAASSYKAADSANIKSSANLAREEKLAQIAEFSDNELYSKIKNLSDDELTVIIDNREMNNAISRYKSDPKRGFKAMNQALEQNAKGEAVTDAALVNDINSITEAIAKHDMPDGVTLYRYEGVEALNKVKVNGEEIDLGTILKELDANYKATGDKSKIEAFLAQEIHGDTVSYEQSHFLSTNIGEYAKNFEDKPIAMELVTKNSKGISIADDSKFNKTELEILLQKDSNITCSVDYNFETNKWILKGEVSN